MTELPAVPLLKAWLEKHMISANRFALKCGLNQSEFHKLLSGKRVRVCVEMAAIIEDATDGEITMRMWIPKRGTITEWFKEKT